MRDFLDDLILPIMCIGGVLAVFFAVVIGLCIALDSYQCSKYESVTQKPTKYAGLACYVQDKGEWYSWTEYKNRLVAKGDFSK